MKRPSSDSTKMRGAFTLVETLVVVAIMALMIGVTASMFSSGLNAQKLAATARTLAGDLKQASMLAAKEGRMVEVRFYRYAPVDVPGAPFFRAYQFALLTGFDGSNKPQYSLLSEVKHFPVGIVLAPGEEYTTLESLPEREKTAGDPDFLPAYSIVSYQISPTGSTTLPRTPVPVITLVEERDAGDKLPANYWSITIDPDNSHTEVY